MTHQEETPGHGGLHEVPMIDDEDIGSTPLTGTFYVKVVSVHSVVSYWRTQRWFESSP